MLRRITCCLALTLLACLQAGAQDRSTPEATVRSFLAAFGAGDMKQAAACVKGAQLSGPALESLTRQIQKDPATITLEDVKSTVDGSNATVAGKISMKSAKSAQAQTLPTQLNLISSGGMWQIVPDAARAHQDANMDMGNGLAYMLTDPSVLTQARDSARATSCLSNMKQLCLGVLMLSQDYDGKYKLKAEMYKKGLMPYVKNDAIFKCPSDSGSASSYSFNVNLAGIKESRLRAPAETVMLYEGKNGKLDFRHAGKATVGFADGHARLVTAEQAKKLRWTP